MSAAFDAVFVVVFMVVAVWVFGFGVGCVLLAHGSRWNRSAAFGVGAMLGPVGLIIIGYSRRSDRVRQPDVSTDHVAVMAASEDHPWPRIESAPSAANPLRPPD